jgi:H/ACA ribonucleoprotein complex subunit 2
MSDSDDNKRESKKQKTTDSASKKASSKTVVTPPTYEERCLAVNAISYPLANKKSTKKCYKLVKKAASTKHLLRRGVKEVIKGVRKNEKGLVVMAGDIYPIDVISHIPLLLEEKNIPYLFVPSKFDLGAAASTKRPTSCVLIKPPSSATAGGGSAKKSSKKSKDGGDDKEESDNIDELYDTLFKEAKSFDPAMIPTLKR